MDLIKFRSVLGWCVVINFVLLLFVAAMFFTMSEFIYGIWQIFYSIPYDVFDIIMISFMALWKILIIVFFAIPYVAIGKVYKK